MEYSEFQKKLVTLLPDIELVMDEPMAKHTSFRIGGPVEVMAFPKSEKELAELLKVSRFLHITPAILGAGTNVLAPDEGLNGLVICLCSLNIQSSNCVFSSSQCANVFDTSLLCLAHSL